MFVLSFIDMHVWGSLVHDSGFYWCSSDVCFDVVVNRV